MMLAGNLWDLVGVVIGCGWIVGGRVSERVVEGRETGGRGVGGDERGVGGKVGVRAARSSNLSSFVSDL